MNKPSPLHLCLFIFYITECLCLRVNLTAPNIHDPRDGMEINCNYDMEGEKLFALKLFRGYSEFFRYIPKHQPEMMVFPIQGLRTDLTKTNCSATSCRVFVEGLSRTFSSGSYMCEVTSDAPSFMSMSIKRNISMVAIPREDPKISRLSDNYYIGDVVQARCSSESGYPKPTLSWLINKQPVNQKYVREISVPTKDNTDENGLEQSTLLLLFPLDAKNATDEPSSMMEFTCVQTVSSDNTTQSSRSSSKIVTVKRRIINIRKTVKKFIYLVLFGMV